MRRLLALLLVAALGLVAACGDDGGSDTERRPVFCARLDRLTRNDPFAAFGGRATSEEIQAAFVALVAHAKELERVAPADARAAAREYSAAARALQSLLEGAGFDGSAVDQRAYRAQQTRYVEASTRLERYLTSEC